MAIGPDNWLGLEAKRRPEDLRELRVPCSAQTAREPCGCRPTSTRDRQASRSRGAPASLADAELRARGGRRPSTFRSPTHDGSRRSVRDCEGATLRRR